MRIYNNIANKAWYYNDFYDSAMCQQFLSQILLKVIIGILQTRATGAYWRQSHVVCKERSRCKCKSALS